MRAIVIVLGMLIFSSGSVSFANYDGQASCNSQIQGGVDILPWSMAQPFPWDNIEGFWSLGDDSSTYIQAKVLGTTINRKNLGLTIHRGSICSKPYAKGGGFINVEEKNVVIALVAVNTIKYQLKMAMFDSRHVGGLSGCGQHIMGLSMRAVGRVKKSKIQSPEPMDPVPTETYNVVLKKVPHGLAEACNNK